MTGLTNPNRQMDESSLWKDTCLVVVDTETTGLGPSARILSIAFYVVENGTTSESWSSLVNPGGHIGAQWLHKLDPVKLAAAPAFPAIAPRITESLTNPAKTVYLCGQNIRFDAERLAYEFGRLGESLPTVQFLDTKTLAPAAGKGTAKDDLETLASLFGLKNPAKHDANADALIAREIALRSIDILLDRGPVQLSDYTRTLFASSLNYVEPDEPISPEHEPEHDRVLTTAKVREASLQNCVDTHCPYLNRRIEDSLTSSVVSIHVLEWVVERLSDTHQPPDRFQAGLLADGGLRAVRAMRNSVKTPNYTKLMKHSLALLDAYSQWVECGTDGSTDLCDRCAHAAKISSAQSDDEDELTSGEDDPVRPCRFVQVPFRLVSAFMRNPDQQVPRNNALSYLYAGKKTPLLSASWYSQIGSRQPDAAVGGAVLAARALRSRSEAAEARPAIAKLWNVLVGNGAVTPGVTEVWAALNEDIIVEQSLDGSARVAVWQSCADICTVGQANGVAGADWSRVLAKQARLLRRINAQLKPPAKNPYNRRDAHPQRFKKI